MAKLMIVGSKRPDLELDEFQRRWIEHNRQVVTTLPNVVRIVHNSALPRTAQSELTFDGVAEIWFNSLEAGLLALASSEGQAVLSAMAEFTDPDKTVTSFVEETTVTYQDARRTRL